MQDDSQSGDHPSPLFQYVETGMGLTYEYESIETIVTRLRHKIQFHPVISARGWSSHKECTASLRVRHLADYNREIGSCLVNQDEIAALQRLLRLMQHPPNSCPPLQLRQFEYTTRHGLKLVWQSDPTEGNRPFFLYVASIQPAVLSDDFLEQLLEIFGKFDSFCSELLSE